MAGIGLLSTRNSAMAGSSASPDPQGLSRRAFLAGTTAAAGMALRTGLSVLAGQTPEPTTRDAEDAANPTGPVVVEARSENVVDGRAVHQSLLREMLDWCLGTLTKTSGSREAWRRLLKPDDVVGLKFNSSGAEEIGTTPAMAEALVASLVDAGWATGNIVLIEAPDSTYDELKVTRPAPGWAAEEVDFGSGRDRLASVLGQVTALVNVPFLKTHNLAGITACLKNLSHAMVKHPARYHANHCSPYIGDIVALPQIRNKLRIHIINALRTVFDGGPEARDDLIWQSGTLLAGFDPVGVDTVGLELLNCTRRKLRLGYVDENRARVAYLDAAAKRGLGCALLYEVRQVKRLF